MSENGVSPLTENPPTREVGSILADPGFIPAWSKLEPVDDMEINAKFVFPQSINTYHNMRPDPQVQGLLTGTTWPILRMSWYLDPNNADEATVERVSADLNLPIGKPDPENPPFFRRTQQRFKFLEHLESALDAIAYGFKVFEQNGYIGPDGMFHYKKLADRPLPTIDQIVIKKDGGIEYIKQNFADSTPIPIEQLVVYSFQRRGANWFGRSLLRGCYAPWLLKDRALRVGVMNIQRAGVGTPIANAAPGATDTDIVALNRLMERFTAGERTGGAVPYGANVRLVGVEGGQPDTVGFIKLMNEEMARAFFQMFMQLGQTTSGSRALGQTFVDYHRLVIEYIAQWFSNIFNEHVIEDDVEWNDGPDAEYAPRLCWAWNENQIDPTQEQQNATDPRQSSATNPGSSAPNRNPSTNVTAEIERLVEAGELEVPEEIRAMLPGQPEPRIPTGVISMSMREHCSRNSRSRTHLQTSPVVASGEAPRTHAGAARRRSAPSGQSPAGASLQVKIPRRVKDRVR